MGRGYEEDLEGGGMGKGVGGVWEKGWEGYGEKGWEGGVSVKVCVEGVRGIWCFLLLILCGLMSDVLGILPRVLLSSVVYRK